MKSLFSVIAAACWITAYASPATTTDDLLHSLCPDCDTWMGSYTTYKVTSTVPPQTCHPTTIINGKSTAVSTICNEKCGGRNPPPPIPAKWEITTPGQYKDGSYECIFDRSKKWWDGNVAQQQCINSCNNIKQKREIPGMPKAIVCMGLFYEDGPHQYDPILMQCPMDSFQLGRCDCDNVGVEILLNQTTNIILPKFGQVLEKVEQGFVLLCEHLTKPFTSLIKSVAEIPADLIEQGVEFVAFLDGSSKLTDIEIDKAEALYDAFVKWMDPCRKMPDAENMDAVLDKIDEAFDIFWSAVLTVIPGAGFAKFGGSFAKWIKWAEEFRGGKGDHNPFSGILKSTDKGPSIPSKTPSPPSKTPSKPLQSSKQSTETPATTTKPSPQPTPTVTKASSTNPPSSSSYLSTSTTPAACRRKRRDDDEFIPGKGAFTIGEGCDTMTVVSITTVHFNQNKPKVFATECEPKNAQACWHYESVISVQPKYSSITCKDWAGTDVAVGRQTGQAMTNWDREHKTTWLEHRFMMNFDQNDYKNKHDLDEAGADTAKQCNRDEYPPIYFYRPGDPEHDTALQRIRWLPAGQNQDAGKLWASFCYKKGLQANKQERKDFGKDPNPEVKSSKKGDKMQTTTISRISMSVDFVPVFSISKFPPGAGKDFGLSQNPCLPKRLNVHEPGFALLKDDEYNKKNPIKDWDDFSKDPIPGFYMQYYNGPGQALLPADYKRDLDGNVTNWDG